MATEIKNGAVHCFTDCGYDCKGQVKVELEAYYNAMLEDLGDGWEVSAWHNCGWHCKAVHKASGFEVSNRQLSGGISEVKRWLSEPGKEFSCMNYGGKHTNQVLVYGSTPREAVKAAIEEMAARAQAYAMLAQDLMKKVK